MADNVQVTEGSGTAVHADEFTDSTYGSGKSQQVKIADGTPGSGNKMVVGSGGSAQVQGEAAENAAAAGNPVLAGGRYDTSDRTLGNGDAGAIALTVAGQLRAVIDDILDDYTRQLGRVKIVNDDGNVVDLTEDTDHDAADAGAPRKIGGYGSDTAPTIVSANGDRVNAWFKRNGSLVSSVQELPSFEYETTAASTNNTLGTGAAGDYLAGVLIIPATTSPGSVQIGDDTTDTTVFAGGADSVSNLVPFFIPINAVSANGAWSVITGADVSAIAVGSFT